MKIHEGKEGSLSFYCPGCKMGHTVDRSWGYNENLDKPTFSAHSVEVNFPHIGLRCHCHVIDGLIKFLPDSTHELSGRSVEFPHFLENYGLN